MFVLLVSVLGMLFDTEESDPKLNSEVSAEDSQFPNSTSRLPICFWCPGISTAEAGIFEGGGNFDLCGFGLCCRTDCKFPVEEASELEFCDTTGNKLLPLIWSRLALAAMF